MELVKVNINELISPSYNPRDITPEEMEKLKTSIQEFGYCDPIIVNKVNNHIVGGNQRYEALKELGYDEVDVVYVHEEDENREKALNIALNKISGQWDKNKLESILEEMELDHFDISLTGFDNLNLDLLNVNNEPFQDENNEEIDYTKGELVDRYENNGENNGILIDKYIVPPFSVFNTNMGYWDDRKKYWDKLIDDKGQSRANVLGEPMGTSLFNSTLAEVIIKWFTPYTNEDIYIYDTFAGDSAMGFIASEYNCIFQGIELRKEQCDLNNERISKVSDKSRYYCDDGQNVLKYFDENSQDLFFSCPPYYDLEVYSDLPNDASNQGSYDDFIKIIDNAFSNAIKCLKDDRFAVIVCGDIRDKQGFYYGFPYDIINIFTRNGMKLYNEIVLYNKIGSAQVRAERTMGNRKVVKVHQNVLVFYKGNPDNIKDNYFIEYEKK